MARPLKQGLDYFPLDVNTDQDDKFQMIEFHHGIEGFAVVIKLMMRVYKEGYYYEWTDMQQMLFSKRVNVDINTVQAVVNDCIKYNIFNKDMLDKHDILTSKGIQERYFEATTRRKTVEYEGKYVLLSLEPYKNVVDVDTKQELSLVNVDINPTRDVVNDDISTQSKVKDSKVKETKEKETIPFAEIVEHLNRKASTKYRHTTGKTKELIRARWNEGFRLDDFTQVIDTKSNEWINDVSMNKFLRPDTLFGTKFEGYLNQNAVTKGYPTEVKRFRPDSVDLGDEVF